MLAYLNGIIQTKEMIGNQADRLIIEVSDVGFDLAISRRTFLAIGEPGDKTVVHTALAIRENDWTLYGFCTSDERHLFCLLQSVTGIGPKLALSLLGAFEPKELVEAILTENHKLICQTPGVGTKVAQRIILELKSKLKDWCLKQGVKQESLMGGFSQISDEVHAVLKELGYTNTEIDMVLQKAKGEELDEDVETLVRYSLKLLGAATIMK